MQHNQMSPELQAKLDGAESLEDVVRVCAEAGITISKEQLEAFTADGELSEDTLDAVSGGGLLADLFDWWRNRGRKRSNPHGGYGAFGGGGSGGGGFRGSAGGR